MKTRFVLEPYREDQSEVVASVKPPGSIPHYGESIHPDICTPFFLLHTVSFLHLCPSGRHLLTDLWGSAAEPFTITPIRKPHRTWALEWAKLACVVSESREK